MADEFQTVSFPMVGGIETSVAEVLLQPPKLLVADNVYAPNKGTLKRRKGLQALSELTVDGGSIAATSQAALARYKDAVLMLESPLGTPNVLEYSQALDRWQEVGKYAPGKVTSIDLTTSSNDHGVWLCDAASNNYLCVVQTETRHPTSATTETALLVTLQDVYGTFICHRRAIATWATDVSSVTRARVVALGNVFLVFWSDDTTRDIMAWRLDTTSAATITTALGAFGGTPAAAVTVATDLHAAGLGNFDVCFSTNGIFLAYETTTANQVKFGFVNSSGVLASTTTKVTLGVPGQIAVATALNGILHAVSFIGTLGVYTFLMSWNGTVWSTTAASGLIDGLTTAKSLACRFDSLTTLRLWYTAERSDGPAVGAEMGAGASRDARRWRIFQSTFTTASVTAARVIELPRAVLFSRPFVGGDSQLYYWVTVGEREGSSGSVQPTIFLVESATGLPVARANISLSLTNLLVTVVTGLAGGYAMPAMYLTRLNNGRATFATGAVNVGVRLVTWVDDHEQSHKIGEVGDCAYMAGGILQQYDGVSFVESGFLRYVESDIINLTAIASGSMALAVYYYRVVEEWTNARGEREQSADTGPTPSVTLGVGKGGVRVTIPTLIMTRRRRATKERSRSNPVFAIYRTLGDPASNLAPYHRVGAVPNDPTADDVTFDDLLADADIADNEELYLVDGEAGHVAPPSAHIMCQGIDRVLLAGVAGEPNTIWPSLLRANGQPLAFSDEISIELPSHGGEITALAALPDGYAVFKKRAIYRVRGPGPNNTLTDGAFLDAELMTDTIGCEGQRSVVETPFGIFFESELGIHLLTPGFQVEFVGEPLIGLEGSRAIGFAGLGISDAIYLPMEQQIRFRGPSVMYIFDYSIRQWFIYTDNFGRGPSVEFNGAHAWCGTSLAGGSNHTCVFEVDDLPYEGDDIRIVLAWFKLPPSLMENFRVRRIAITGEVTDVANVRVQLYKNLVATVRQTIEIDALPAGRFQVRRRLGGNARVLSALQIEVDDNLTKDDGVLSLNEITLELHRRSSGLTARID